MSVRLVVAAAAAAVVAYVSSDPYLTAQTFVAVYGVTGFLDPNKRVLGPKLNDLKAPQANYGAPIPYLEGAPRLAGCVIWASEKREIATTTESKGGPGVDSTVFTYEIDIGYELAINQSEALRRVWSNGKLVWTNADDSSDDSIAASEETTSWRDIRFYGGDPAQLPDASYEALVGVGNAPAYRGRTTVVVEGLNLGGSGQLPVLTFEVVRFATVTTIPPKVLLQASFMNESAADASYYSLTPTVFGGATLLVDGMSTNNNAFGNVAYVRYQSSNFDHTTASVLSIQAQSSWQSLANTSNAIFTYQAGASHYWRVSWYGTTGSIGYDSSITAPGTHVFPVTSTGATVLLVIGPGTPSEVKLYIDGALVMTVSETNTNEIGNGNILAGATDNNDFVNTQLYTVTNLRVAARVEETFFGDLPEPDGPLTRASIDETPLSDVVSRLCLRTGLLTAGDIDVTELEDDVVRALGVTQVSTSRVTLEMLMGAYLFEAVEGEKLRFVKRGGASVMTIAYDDLGASADGTAEPLPKRRLNDIELAARVSVKYANVLNDFQDGLEVADRLVTDSTAETVIELPIGFTPTEAKRLADANTMDLAVSLLQIGPIGLPRKYAALEPTDVVTVTGADGSTFRARIVKSTAGGGITIFDLVLDDATAINSEAETDETYASSVLVRVITGTEAEYLDIPALRDADTNAPGFYVAAKPDDAGGVWPGYELDRSPDDVTYYKVYDSAARAVFGTASSALGTFVGNTFDEVNTLSVDVGDGTLSSSTRASMLDGIVNALLVGSEVVQFRTASLVSPGVYLLSGFLRGRRGTEWAIPDHGTSERVVLLETGTLRRVNDEVSDIDVPFFLKAVTHGRNRASTQEEEFTDTGVSLKPFAPVDLRINDAVELVWNRRSRLSSRFLTTEPPLGEASESYDVEIVDVADVVLVTATVATPVYDISSPPVGADRVLVYQRSATVGRGYPATLEL